MKRERFIELVNAAGQIRTAEELAEAKEWLRLLERAIELKEGPQTDSTKYDLEMLNREAEALRAQREISADNAG